MNIIGAFFLGIFLGGIVVSIINIIWLMIIVAREIGDTW